MSTFQIEGDAKFQLEVSENKDLMFTLPSSQTSSISKHTETYANNASCPFFSLIPAPPLCSLSRLFTPILLLFLPPFLLFISSKSVPFFLSLLPLVDCLPLPKLSRTCAGTACQRVCQELGLSRSVALNGPFVCSCEGKKRNFSNLRVPLSP